MRKTIIAIGIGLGAGFVALFMLVSLAAAAPRRLEIDSVEPDTLVSETGGSLSIYGSDFTTATVARLVGFGLLETGYVNPTALTAVVPAGVAPGTYDLQVTEAFTTAELAAAVTIVAATPTRSPTPLPTATSPPPPGRPVLTIRNYSIEPSRAVVGREFVVTVEIYNNGSRAGENTMVTFPGGTFLPVGETGHLLGTLHINHTAVVTQLMRVPSGLASGSYNLQVSPSANDWEGSHYEYPDTVGVEVIGVGHGRPQLVIERAQTLPDVLGPGDTFSLTLCLANRGDRTATDVLVGVSSGDLAVPARGSNFVGAGPVRINGTSTVTLPLVLGQVMEAGRTNLELALEYSDYQGGAYAAHQSVGVEVSTALEDRPQILVAGYETEPDPLSPGETFTLTLALSNVGGGEALRLMLTLGGEEGVDLDPFAPLASGNVRFLPRVDAGDVAEVVQQLIVDGSADPGVYSLPVLLAYDDARGTRHTDSQRISLLVRREPHLEIGFYRPVREVRVGVPFELPIEVTNIGSALVNVSTLEVDSPQLDVEGGSIYLGPLDGGTSGSLEATATAQQGGPAELVVTVRYLDDFDQPRVVTETLTVEVEEPDVAPGAAEEESEEGGFWDRVLRVLKGLLGLGS